MTGASYLLEFSVMGRYLRVTAIDPVTGEEASLRADARGPRGPLGKMAVRKLRRQQGKSDEVSSASMKSDDDSWA